MRLVFGMLATIVMPVATLAQVPASITATPLLPPSVQSAPPQPAPQSAPQRAPDQTQPRPPAARAAPAPTVDAPPGAPQPIQSTWLPQATALLQVLDKVNAQNAVLTVKVGEQAQFGSLNIQVQACDIHPPDQPQDSAVYLTITDSHADAPGFRGWMLANNPSLSMLQHPIYDVRVVGCRA
jgi:hypothetical protein